MSKPALRTVILCAVFLIRQNAPALDLTPLEGFKELEGMKIPVVLFTESRGKVQYKPPGNWKLIGKGNAISLIPPNVDQVLVKFIAFNKKKSGTAAPPAAPETSEELKAWAVQFIPVGAKEVAFDKEVPSPFTLEGRESSEFIFNYVLSGSPETVSVAITDLNEAERFVAIVSARKKDFDALHQQTIASLFSWAPVK